MIISYTWKIPREMSISPESSLNSGLDTITVDAKADEYSSCGYIKGDGQKK
jgi:hypothetical protein